MVQAFLENYKEIEDSIIGNNLPWLKKIRQDSINKFINNGLPSHKLEPWKYSASKIYKLGDNDFSSITASDNENIDISSYIIKDLDCYNLIFINGIFNKDLSNIIKDANFTNIATSIDNKDLQKYFENDLNKDDSINNLNNAFFNDGIYIKLNNNINLAKPVHIINIATSGEYKSIYTKNIIEIGNNCTATFIESFHSASDNKYLNNIISNVTIGKDSNINHYKIKCENNTAIHLENANIDIGKNSNYNNFTFNIGAKISRNEIISNLNDEYANCKINGAFLTKNDQFVDNYLPIYHHKPNCNSQQIYKSIIDNNSHGVFYGKIIVPKDAYATNSEQLNNNLLLSEKAKISSRPELTILTDDVKCSHGSTTGQIDEDAIFYLKSRAISELDAKNMLIKSFIVEQFDFIDNDKIKDYLLLKLENWLN